MPIQGRWGSPPWKTRYTISIPLPPPHDLIRHMCILVHEQEMPSEQVRARALLLLVDWAQEPAHIHPDLPEYHHKSYLPAQVTFPLALPELEERLAKMGVTIYAETSPNLIQDKADE